MYLLCSESHLYVICICIHLNIQICVDDCIYDILYLCGCGGVRENNGPKAGTHCLHCGAKLVTVTLQHNPTLHTQPLFPIYTHFLKTHQQGHSRWPLNKSLLSFTRCKITMSECLCTRDSSRNHFRGHSTYRALYRALIHQISHHLNHVFFWQQDPHAAEVGYGEKAVGQVAPQLPHFTHQILPTQSHGPTTHSSANLAIRASLSLHLTTVLK